MNKQKDALASSRGGGGGGGNIAGFQIHFRVTKI